MRPGRDRDRYLTEEMLRHLKIIEEGARTGRAGLRDDTKMRYAVEHATELLAEAAKHTSSAFRTANPEIPWRSLPKIRRVMAHPYDLEAEEKTVDQLWRFASADAPVIARRLRRARFAAEK